MAVYLRGSLLADSTQPENGYRFLRWLFFCPDEQKGRLKMKWLNCARIRLMLVGFVAAIVLSGGGRANADFTFGTPANF